MAQLAEQITRHYDEPAQQSRPPIPEPFPPAVMHGLSLGAAQGAAVGAVIGYVLANNMLVVPGWELMYSAAPATIITLWLFLGAALGVATVGVGTLLTTPAALPQEQAASGERTAESSAQHERVVGEH
ncbi:MAG: hypothetical protein HGA45_08675 [Chloroflexales bacterium]|nr:hypothetical protein [Chloroflexales bacterium]